MESSLNKLFLVDNHIVTQEIESKLIVCDICNITAISLPALVIVHAAKYHADLKS